jgi:hypothetical protein
MQQFRPIESMNGRSLCTGTLICEIYRFPELECRTMIRMLLMSIAALALVTVASVPPVEAGSNVRSGAASTSGGHTPACSTKPSRGR